MAFKRQYERDDDTFPADAYRVDGHSGIAWYVLGWETEPTDETEWSGMYDRTGGVVCVMIGDDRHFVFDPEDVKPIDREDYCGECGQMGCRHDGLSRAD